MDSTRFYPQLKDKLRQNNDSYNSKTLKQTYQSAIKMTVSTPKTMDSFEEYVVNGRSRETLPLTKVTEFQSATVITFGALYEASGTNVYSTDDMIKHLLKCTHLYQILCKGIPRH